MKDIQKRLFSFLFLCVGLRLFIVYLAKTDNKEHLRYMAVIALLPAIGFITIYLLDLRNTGPEVMGNKIWWNDLRPLHGCLYLLFAIYAFKGSNISWKILLFDVIIGLFSFLYYHSGQINCKYS